VLGLWAGSRFGAVRLVARVACGFPLMALYAAPAVRRRLGLPA
jgi:hypothetical protein